MRLLLAEGEWSHNQVVACYLLKNLVLVLDGLNLLLAALLTYLYDL